MESKKSGRAWALSGQSSRKINSGGSGHKTPARVLLACGVGDTNYE